MTEEERFKITSNEYADLIIEYNQNMRVFDAFPGATVHIMNARYAVVYVPASQLTVRSISRYGLSAIPACLGLASERGLEASGVTRLRRLPAFNLRGQGVLIGIIDTGIDYTNPIFRNADGTTRIAALWDQTIDTERYPLPYFYGTQYLREDINQALASENPLEIVPSVDEIGHGTIMAGIAAGSEVPDSDFSGVVPEAEFVIVKLKQAKEIIRQFHVIPPNVPCYQNNDFIWAVQYVIEIARNLQRPVSMCIGMGSSQQSHDGRGPLGTHLSIGADFPGVVITIAAGNEGNARRHFYDEIDPAIGFSTVEMNVGENESGFSMSLWGAAPNTYSIDILSPSGEYIPRITESLRVSRDISFLFEQTSISVDYLMVESAAGDQLILMRFRNPTPGTWRFQVYGRGNLRGTFHVWLPMDDFITDNTYFLQPDPYTTITDPGNAMVPITVTAYDPDNNNLYPRASRGYTRTEIVKPEFAAPGVDLISPTLNQGFAERSGTSLAAAHTAGIAAMLLEWGIVDGNYPGIDTVEVKQFLIRGARRNPGLSYPNRDWGYGILDIYNVFDVLRSSIQSGS
jgi:subtilisin family serine protease